MKRPATTISVDADILALLKELQDRAEFLSGFRPSASAVVARAVKLLAEDTKKKKAG